MDFIYNPKSKLVFGFLFFSLILTTGCNPETNNLINGSVEVNFTQIAPTIGGRLEEINVEIGEQVKNGSSLFRLDNTQELSALNEITARVISAEENIKDLQSGGREDEIAVVEHRLSEAKAMHRQAQIDYQRNLKLHREKIIADRVFDQSKTNLRVAKAKVESINSELQVIKSPARSAKIRSQVALAKAMRELHKQKIWKYSQKEVFTPKNHSIYVVENIYFQVGEYVPAGIPVVNLYSPKNIFLRFYVNETNLSKIRVGNQIVINCDGCEEHKAKINYIATQAEYTPPILYNRENRSKLVYRVEATPENPEKLHIGMPVDININ